MRRRFAGEGIGSAAALPADTLAAATESLKAAQASLKGSRGARLGQGSETEREEAKKSKAAGSETTVPTAAVAPTVAAPGGTADIASLRKALGIEDLLTSLRGMGTGETAETPKFEMPEFKMPEFEMPEFEAPTSQLPDFEKIFADAFARYAPPKTEGTTATTPSSPPTAAATPTSASKISVGNKSYDLAKTGGKGLGSRDIKVLEKKGWSKSEIKQVAKQAPRVSAGAQKVLGGSPKAAAQAKAPSAKAQTTAKNLTSSAKTAIAKASSKNTGKKK
jgi:hypothetical protein